MKTKQAIRRRESPEFWERHVRERETSGLSQSRYCQVNDLGIKSFQYWKRKLATRAPNCLVELPISLVARQCPTLHLQVGSRYRIAIETGFDPETLRCLLGIIEER
jgi:hypothetical protein